MPKVKVKPRYSRRRYAETVRCLKSAIKNEALPWVQRLHAIQLLFVVYELPLPEQVAPSTRSLKVVKELMEQRSLERELMRETRAAEAEKEQARITAQTLQFLKETA